MEQTALPERPSIWFCGPRLGLAMPQPVDATGGCQVASAWGDPWWCCGYCGSTVAPMAPPHKRLWREVIRCRIKSLQVEGGGKTSSRWTQAPRRAAALPQSALAAAANSLLSTALPQLETSVNNFCSLISSLASKRETTAVPATVWSVQMAHLNLLRWDVFFFVVFFF